MGEQENSSYYTIDMLLYKIFISLFPYYHCWDGGEEVEQENSIYDTIDMQLYKFLFHFPLIITIGMVVGRGAYLCV